MTSYNASIGSDKVWDDPATGKGVGVAVIDTGIAGNLADFQVSQSNGASRVVASAVTNPYATTANDTYGHGTHVAGIIAGNGNSRSSSDSLRGEYIGVAPDANLISIKASDDKGEATILDAIYGLQFAVDFKDDYNIRVANLSLESSVAESYKTDPLDAAVESAWFSGIVVVAAAGNRGTRLRRGPLRARQRPVRDLRRRGRRPRHEGPRGRQARELVEPRSDAGRLQQA